jgi:hypothetical protein
VTARNLVGCDGASSRVRDLVGIPFPGTTYPEVQRLAQVTVPGSVTVLEDGDLDVAGVGRINFGFTRTERGEFALGSTAPSLMGLYTSEEESADHDGGRSRGLSRGRPELSRHARGLRQAAGRAARSPFANEKTREARRG